LKERSTEFTRLWGYSVGFYGVWIAYIGRQLKLFDCLSRGPMTLEELVSATKLYPPAVRVWCSAAHSYRFINIKNNKLQLSKSIKMLLVDRTSPDYLGGQFSYLALRSLEYGAFEDLFKSGKTQEMISTLNAIENATDWDHYGFLAAVRRNKRLHMMLSKGCRLLDVGCGTGSMLVKLDKEYPKSRMVGIDPSEKAIAMARQISNSRSITLVKTSGESMKYSEEFDIVYLGESLYPTKNKEKVVLNCWRALKKGGSIAIIEGLLPQRLIRRGESQLIMGMQLDFALQGHNFMNKTDMLLLLNDKFSRIRFEDLGGCVFLVTAMK
jgi:2-polyprenyl-3-methyl-5-hydroxy-6-metoxy-1,4-benzoquinol methylase